MKGGEMMSEVKIDTDKLKKFPIKFSKIKNYDNEETDTRFTKCKIFLMHDGLNFNNSYFSQDVINDAIPSLANIPILAYIEEDKNGNENFKGHEYRFVTDKNGNTKMKYLGHAFGLIPENNNAHFEKHVDDLGVERDYLVCEGLLWSKLEATDILEELGGSTNQSMEISSNYSGKFSEEGYFVFDKFQFEGSCLISCEPAMSCSHVTLDLNEDFSKQDKNDIHFSSKNIAKEIENKLKEFEKIVFSNKNTQKDKEVDDKDMAKNKEEDKKKEEIVITENAKEENKDKKVETKVEEVKTEEPKEKEAETDNAKDDEKDKNIEETAKNEDSNVEENADDDKKAETEEKDEEDKPKTDNSKKQFSINFELSHEDIRSKLYNKLFNLEALENTCYGIECVKNEYFIYFDYVNNQYFKQAYSVENDEVKFNGEREEVYNVFVDKVTRDELGVKAYSKLKEELENANSKLAQFSKENKELKEFKAIKDEETRKSQIDNVLNKFSKIEGLNLEDYKTKAYNKEIALENLEGMIYQEIGKKNFSMAKVDEEVKENKLNYTVSINENEDACPYASLQQYFK